MNDNHGNAIDDLAMLARYGRQEKTTMTTAPHHTSAGHRAAAEKDLDTRRVSGYSPSNAAYGNLTLSAAVHVLIGISEGLDILAAYLEPPPVPQVPGLPAGWQIATDQDPAGSRKWGYTLTPPGRPPLSNRHRWDTSEGALTAGIRHAQLDVTDNQMPGTQAGVTAALPQNWDPRSGMDDQALRDNGIRG